MNYTLKSPAAQNATAADLCADAKYSVIYTADYGEHIGIICRITVDACDSYDAEREAKRQCRRDGGSNIRDISARFIGRAK